MIISPKEIQQQVRKWEKKLLLSHVTGESFFPKAIKFPKVKAKATQKHFEALHLGLLALKEQSKNVIGQGYFVNWVERNDQKIGRNSFPDQITIESLEDYFFLAGKKHQQTYERFCEALSLIRKSLPQLEDWLPKNVLKLAPHLEIWPDLLNVCHYFLENPKPNLYIRELPISIHTKFIEEHKSLIDNLLQFLLPPSSANTEFTGLASSNFEKRYGLKYAEPLVRIRFLDPTNAPADFLQDCSLPLSQFCQLQTSCTQVIISENKMTFLSLPVLPNTLAIFGKGYDVNALKNAQWLSQLNIYYWGDIDVNGFDILSNLRKHFPQAQSLMMDWATFHQFEAFQVNDPKTKIPHVERLNAKEKELFDFLAAHCQNPSIKNRLEQEHVGQGWVLGRLGKI